MAPKQPHHGSRARPSGGRRQPPRRTGHLPVQTWHHSQRLKRQPNSAHQRHHQPGARQPHQHSRPAPGTHPQHRDHATCRRNQRTRQDATRDGRCVSRAAAPLQLVCLVPLHRPLRGCDGGVPTRPPQASRTAANPGSGPAREGDHGRAARTRARSPGGRDRRAAGPDPPRCRVGATGDGVDGPHQPLASTQAHASSRVTGAVQVSGAPGPPSRGPGGSRPRGTAAPGHR